MFLLVGMEAVKDSKDLLFEVLFGRSSSYLAEHYGAFLRSELREEFLSEEERRS
jgi:hypothetical protein